MSKTIYGFDKNCSHLKSGWCHLCVMKEIEKAVYDNNLWLVNYLMDAREDRQNLNEVISGLVKVGIERSLDEDNSKN